jgi:hypothetical protein
LIITDRVLGELSPAVLVADLVLSKITDDLMHSSDRKKAKAAKFTSRDLHANPD